MSKHVTEGGFWDGPPDKVLVALHVAPDVMQTLRDMLPGTWVDGPAHWKAAVHSLPLMVQSTLPPGSFQRVYADGTLDKVEPARETPETEPLFDAAELTELERLRREAERVTRNTTPEPFGEDPATPPPTEEP